MLTASQSLSSQAEGAEKLRWKFKVGEKLNYQMVQNMNMAMQVMGQNINMNMNQTMDMVWKGTKVHSDGTTDLSQTITRIRFTMSGGPIGKVEYDSANPNLGAGNPIVGGIAKMFNALVGQEFTMQITARGELKNIKMPQKFLDSLKQGAAGRIPGMLNADTLKEMVGKSGIIFPEKAISKGDTWNSKMELKNPVGTIKVATKYVHNGTVKGLEKIQLTPKMTMVPNPGSPFNIKLSDQSGGGTVLFDAKAGRIVSSSMKQKMVMVIAAGGQNIEQTVNQTIEMKLQPAKSSK
ncbi:MAG: hypothetical protein Tsb009_05420 [Planctomycetaceae bacterium]